MLVILSLKSLLFIFNVFLSVSPRGYKTAAIGKKYSKRGDRYVQKIHLVLEAAPERLPTGSDNTCRLARHSCRGDWRAGALRLRAVRALEADLFIGLVGEQIFKDSQAGVDLLFTAGAVAVALGLAALGAKSFAVL